MLAAGLLLVLTLIAGVSIGGLQTYSGHFLGGIPWLWQWANEAVSFLVIVVLFAMIYKYLPDVRLGWRDVWLGAVVTGVLFAAGKFGIGFYLGHTGIAGSFWHGGIAGGAAGLDLLFRDDQLSSGRSLQRSTPPGVVKYSLGDCRNPEP